MLPTTIRSPPSLGDFVPLAEYQSQTPESFADGKPVLHLHLTGAKATLPQSQRGNLAIFPADAAPAKDASANGGDHVEPVVEQTVDVFVNSENFTIFSNGAEAGVSIPYPAISIHAVKQVAAAAVDGSSSHAVWMQLEFSDGGDTDDDFNTVDLTIIPPTASTTTDSSSSSTTSPASQLYEAIASCSNLHPDPNDEGDEEDEDPADRIIFEGSAEHEALEGFTGVMRGAPDGGLPPPMPGSGGWITADNVHEYFDEDGNWIGGGVGGGAAGGDDEGEELGEGAGRIRNRDELEGEDAAAQAANGQGNGDDQDSKRPRVE